MVISGQFVDILNKRIFPAKLTVSNGFIESIEETEDAPAHFLMPGFVDAHVHIESSLLAPSEFARMAVIHGTIATISDPHEIANVFGVQGVEFMVENGLKVPFHFNFGAPSCVPATSFETAGATINAEQVDWLLQQKDILYLSEVMNYPGVIHEDPELLKKIAAAHKYGKPIDGHAPGLSGDSLRKYIAEGISTDHECFTLDEALEKLKLGMTILIREGSAAKNFETLIPLMDRYFEKLMFCSDDKHPDELIIGHINQLVARALALGYDLFKILQVACLNPVNHYGMKHGTLNVGDTADFIVVADLVNFKVLQTYIGGNLVAENGKSLIQSVPLETPNLFQAKMLKEEDVKFLPTQPEPVIVCIDGQLITQKVMVEPPNLNLKNDCLKLVVLNRYMEAQPAIAFIQKFGLKNGAIASSVAHDSHNIIAVGTSDALICKAINLVIEHKGALVACNDAESKVLPLPIAGIMSDSDAWFVANAYADLDRFSKENLGSTLKSPFMSLSFMALLVIPKLKLSDMGLFDGENFAFLRKNKDCH